MGGPHHKAEWMSRHLLIGWGSSGCPSGKPRPAAGEASEILAEKSGLSLSLSIIYWPQVIYTEEPRAHGGICCRHMEWSSVPTEGREGQ